MNNLILFKFIDPLVVVKRKVTNDGRDYLYADTSELFKKWANDNCEGSFRIQMDITRGVEIIFERLEDAALCRLTWK